MADISALGGRRSSTGSALDGYFGAESAAMNSIDRFTEKRASNRAGQAMKARNYGGAADEFYDAGLLGQGSEVQNYGQAQDDRAKSAEAETVKKRGTFLVQLARGLKDVPDADRNAQFERFAPALKTLGADDDLIEQLRQAPKDNASLDMFSGGIEKELEQYTLSPGSRRYNEKGQLVAEAPFAPEYKNVGEGDTLVQVGGGSSAPQSSGGDPLAVIESLTASGARVTSARRSPDRNAAVGGSPNSYHLTGRARDIVPPPGMSMSDLEKRLRSSGVEFAEIINEGDHIHVAWAGEGAGPGAGGARVIARGPPKPGKEQSRPATDAEKAVYGIPSSTPAQMKPDGTIDVITLPKGTADVERDAQAKQAQILKAKDIISTVDAAMAKIGKGEAGFVGAKMAEVPGTKAYDVSRQIETIKANLGFQELAAMRAASPTGGALGAIAVQELVALQSTVANLDIGQSESQLRGNLSKIKSHYTRWLNATQGVGAPSAGNGAADKPAQRRMTPAEASKLRPGTRFIGMDGVERTRR